METIKLFIGGERIAAERCVPLYSPYSGEKLAEVPAASEAETEAAIAAADGARQAMAQLHAHERAAILERVAALLQARKAEAARLVALESGKPLKFAEAEIDRTVQTYKFAAEEAKRIYGETIPLDAAPGGEGRLAYTVRKPLGVIGAITPFNFPFNLVAHKLGPAIAAGNAVVLKPASQTPLSAYFIGELFAEAGLPAGGLNIVTGSGATVGGALVRDARIAMISFTGSPETGRSIRSEAGLKRTTLELGSNAAVIVDRDADLAKIVPRCVAGAYSNQGQVCISLQRIYVHEELYDEFVAAFAAETAKLKLGDPLDLQTDVSAMISQAEAARALSWVEEAVAAGAVVAAGGRINSGTNSSANSGTNSGRSSSTGHASAILEPTVLTGVAPALKVSCSEIFAPVAVIGKISSMDEAFALVNDSRYGLQAGIYTNDLATALRAADELHVGGVIINDIPTFRVDHMPYGGVKESGTGREGVKYAVEEMTELKLVVINR